MFRLCLLGAQGTGKTTLARALTDTLRTRGHRVTQSSATQVDDTQADDVLLADAPPLVATLHVHMAGGDASLLAAALAHQRSYQLNLLMGLDLPGPGAGSERAQQREAVDALLRETLQAAGIGYRVVYGRGEARLTQALRAVDEWLAADGRRAVEPSAAWVWNCEKCSDPACEHRLFRRLTGP